MNKNINLIMNKYIKLKNVEQFIESDYTFRLINNETNYELTGFKPLLEIANIPDTFDGKTVVSIGINLAYRNNLKSVTIPDTVTSIGIFAFRECSSLSTITITDDSQLNSIGIQSFYNTKIASINIPDTVTSIGDSAFQECSSLSTVTITDDSQLNSIGNYAFNNTKIASINIPDTVTSIGDGAFQECILLSTVTINKTSKSV
jgi:hypothetical protein